MAHQGNLEPGRSLLETGRRQPGPGHLADHTIYAVAQTLDKAHVGQDLHNDLVPAEPLLDEVVDSDMSRQAARAVELDPVPEHQHADLVTANPVVAMGDGIDDGLPDRLDRVLGFFDPLQAQQANPPAHIVEHKGLGTADLLRERAVDLIPHKGVAHGCARVTDHQDQAGTHPSLRLTSKEEQPGVRWKELAVS